MKNRTHTLLLALLAAFALMAAACSDAEGDDAETTDDDTAETTEAMEEEEADDGDDEGDDESTDTTEAAEESEESMEEGDTLRIAIVAPSASDDLAFTQSMIESIEAIGESRSTEVSVTDGTFIVDDAAAAIRGYAEDGNHLVIVHGTQFGGSLEEIAPDFPEVSFAWGTSADNLGLENVFSYAPLAEEGGYVLGTIAGLLSEGTIGVIGPVEAGDAVSYINGFTAGAEAAQDGVNVAVTYTGSFSDVALMTEAANAQISNGADVLTGSSQAVVGAVGVAEAEGIPWFGTQADQSSLGSVVVASQVYRWDVVLEEMVANIDAGVLGGENYFITLENGGLEIAYNDAYDLPAEAKEAADAAIAGIIDGSITVEG